MELLEMDRTAWPSATGCSKRKQAHTVIVECEDDLLISPPDEPPQLPYHHHLGLLDSLDSLLISRQNSGVFLKDPNVCLMDWASIMATSGPAAATAATSAPELERKHPSFQDLYSSFESRELGSGEAAAGAAAVSIIPLTPDQVSRLTGCPTQQAQHPDPTGGLLIASPVSMTTEASASTLTPPLTTALIARGRQPARRRRRTAATTEADRADDEDDDADDSSDGNPDYRRRRDRNNVAVRKSRAKTRAREQVVDQTLGRLRHNNEDLRKKVESVVRELKFLKSLMHKTRIPMPQDLLNALRTYPMYFEPVD